MKTQTATFRAIETTRGHFLPDLRQQTTALTQRLLRGLLAGASAMALLVAAIWAASDPSLATYLAVGIWGAGFVFFALAVDAGSRWSVPLVLSGMTLPALAVLGDHIAAEFSMLAAVIVAAWLAAWIYRRK